MSMFRNSYEIEKMIMVRNAEIRREVENFERIKRIKKQRRKKG